MIDAIKNSVLENFDTTLSSGDILAGLAVAIAAGLFILLIYKFTMQQVTFNRSYCVSLLLVSVISAMMVLTMAPAIEEDILSSSIFGIENSGAGAARPGTGIAEPATESNAGAGAEAKGGARWSLNN